MKNMIRSLSIFLAVIMLAATLGACGKSETAGDSSTANSSTAASSSQAEQIPEEPIEISVINAAGGTPAFGTGDPVFENNPIAKKILEKFNVKLKFDMLTGDGKQQMGLKLASGDYSDVIIKLSSDVYTKMLSENMLIPLETLIDENAPDIKKAYGEKTLNFLKSDDGHLYSLTQGYGNIPEGTEPPGFGFGYQLRKDIYEGLGSPKIETLDDVYNVLKQIKADPKLSKTSDGKSVWPIGTFKRSWYNMIQALEAIGGSGTSKWIVENNEVKFWFKAPWALDMIKFYNKLYREQLLDPESFTIDPAAWQKDKVNTARIASTFGSWYMVADAWGQFKTTNLPNSDNMWYMNFPVRIANTGAEPQLVGVSSVGNGATVITNKAKNPKAIMKVLNYFASPEGNFEVLNGVEGTQWEMKDGKPAIKAEYLQRWANGEGDDKFAAETGLALYKGFVSTDVGRSPWGTYWILKDDPTLTNRPDFAQRDQALGKFYWDSAPFNGVDVGLADDLNMKYSTIDGKLNDAVYNPILAKTEAECISLWEKFVKDMDAAGASEVEAAVTANYKKNISKLGN